MKFIIKTVIILAAITAIGVLVWWILSPAAASRTNLHKTEVADIRALVELCTVEITEDIPVKGHVGPKHLFARQTVNGSISFDLDKLEITEDSDSALTVVLPPEIVEIHESTEPNSYEVIDVWNENLLGSAVMTTAQENAIKRKVCDNFRKKIYTKGYVRRARSEARSSLSVLLGALTGKNVTVTDPSPEGYYGK